MMMLWKQASLAIATELASLSMLDQSNSAHRLYAYFALHAVASALVTSIAWVLLPARLRQPRWAVLGLIFSFDFFIPGLAVVAMLVAMQVAIRFPKAVRPERYAEIVEPHFFAREKDSGEQSDIRVGYARRILRDPAQSVDNKLRVLIALQDMRPKVAIPLLQSLLSDPAEDIRLLAYSMMDAWEKDLTQRLQAAQAQMDATPAPEADSGYARSIKINGHRRLAELYWEQVDTGLVRGDLRLFALTQAKEQCESALPLDSHVAGLWLLYAQILIELEMPDAAQRALRNARKAGMGDAQVLPLLARIAFDARDFHGVAQWMARASKQKQLPHTVRRLAQYWTGKMLDVRL